MNRSARTAEDRSAFRERKAAEFRALPTPAEQAMAALLDLMGLLYAEQVPLEIGAKGCVLDFLLADKPICIEVDGRGHKKGHDARRDRSLVRYHGIRTIRFSNAMVLKEPDKVRVAILGAIERP